MADRAPDLDLPREQFTFEPWSVEGEVEFLASLSVGIMPLANGIWERGKCSYKMLAYMASGLPTVVSPVGMNVDVLAAGDVGFGAVTDDEWIDALRFLVDEPDSARSLGLNGRQVVQSAYDVESVADRLAQALTSVAA
jgi:glycosyltransferase involved in cell wall biosynthesis